MARKRQQEDPELALKRERFILAYLGEARGNGAEAARMAGYSEANARFEAARLLTNANVRARIDEVLNAEAMSAAEVLHEVTRVAQAPITAFMQVIRPAETDDDGNETAPMMVRLDYGAKVKSLELLGKYHQLWTDKIQHSGEVLIRGYDGVDPNDV